MFVCFSSLFFFSSFIFARELSLFSPFPVTRPMFRGEGNLDSFACVVGSLSAVMQSTNVFQCPTPPSRRAEVTTRTGRGVSVSKVSTNAWVKSEVVIDQDRCALSHCACTFQLSGPRAECNPFRYETISRRKLTTLIEDRCDETTFRETSDGQFR